MSCCIFSNFLDLTMADVAKPEQATNTNATVETKEPQKVVENNAAPVEAEKKESPVKEEKSETPGMYKVGSKFLSSVHV